MARKDVYQIHPTGYQDDPEEQTFPLADLDHIMPKMYVQIPLVFELTPETDTSKIINNLKAGLEVTLSEYPVLSGTLQMSAENGRIWILRKRENTVGLTVNWIDSPEDNFPSYEGLNKADFPASLIDGDILLPDAVTAKQLFSPLGDNDEKYTLISTFQVNIIRGGLMLCLAVHHSCSDGPGCNGFLTQCTENSKALTTKSPLRPLDPIDLDRSRLSSKTTPDATRMAELSQNLPIFKHVKEAPPPPPPDFQMPELAPVMWHFPQSACEKLKADAKPGEKDGWVSTYDSIMAILWKTITRSRIPMYKPDLSKEVFLVHAVNKRSKLEPPLPDRYLGNAVSLARTRDITIEAILADGSLPELASAIRTSISSINDQAIHETAEWVAGTQDKRWIAMALNPFLGMDLAGTSWQTMNAYSAEDFGFGLPKALRFPKPAWEGYVFVYPHRPKKNVSDEGIEVCVCLEKGCQMRLMEDEELGAYAYPRE